MNIFAAVALVAILVFIHESGHFIVAKLCGVHVQVFSIGFGRRLIGFEYGGTDYRLSLLPFGGYVMMAGADPFGYGDEDDDLLDDPESSFMRRPVWQRLLVMIAGPGFNLILPIVVFTALFMAGEPQPAPIIGDITSEAPAAEAGMLPGDRIVRVGGQEIATWLGMREQIAGLGAGTHEIVVERSGAELSLSVTLTEEASSRLGISHSRIDSIIGVDDPTSPAGSAGLRTGDRIVGVNGAVVGDWVELTAALQAALQSDTLSLTVDRAAETFSADLSQTQWAPRDNGANQPATERWGIAAGTLFVGEVGETANDSGDDVFAGCSPGPPPPPSPAFSSGIEPGDRFFRLDGEPVRSWIDVLNGVQGTMEGTGDEATARALAVELIRDGELISLDITPKVIRDTDAVGQYYYRPILGTSRGGGYVDGPTTRQYYPFTLAISRATEETVLISGLIIEQLGKLITNEAAVEKSLGGPVEIVRQASAAAEKGLFTWARLMAMLSISLGIINLVPVPVLDGGQILFYLIEGIRGRPVSHVVRERAQQIGVLFLVLLMLMVLVFDIRRLLVG
ncbi:MAG: RIP metalloprotease RseP [Myxococcota bacterium]|nr:RIP metalloprotease RseP [Myxococcota bacterium]